MVRHPTVCFTRYSVRIDLFDKVLGSFQYCKVDILEMDVVVNGNMGLVCTIQNVGVVLMTGEAKRLLVRETDCFERRNGAWKLIHQRAPVPSGGDWDGKITTPHPKSKRRKRAV